MRRLSEDDLEIVGFLDRKPVRPTATKASGVHKRATPGPKTPPLMRQRGASPGAAFHFGLNGPSALLRSSNLSDSTSKTTKRTTRSDSTMRSYAKLVKVLDPSTTQQNKRLTDSPHTKELLKDFYRKLRAKAKVSVETAKNYAEDSLDSLPSKAHWRVYKELADIARRQHNYEEARAMFARVNELQPYAATGWIEHAKMVEDHGDDESCALLLAKGLKSCRFNETLLIQILKFEERRGNLQNARDIMGRLKDRHVQRTWRVLLEGALVEARAGNVSVARRVFQYVINAPGVRYGPVFLEAARFEERIGEHFNAVRLVEMGLQRVSHYGPLWFAAFRMHERLEAESGRMPIALHLPRTRNALNAALQALPPELRWKVHFVAAQVEMRAAAAAGTNSSSNTDVNETYVRDCVKRCREAFTRSVTLCPTNLKWKVRAASARLELRIKNTEEARRLLDEALNSAPTKYRSLVLIERAHLEELTGNVNEARKYLDVSMLLSPSQQMRMNTTKEDEKSKKNSRVDGRWRLVHSNALLELRAGNLTFATETVRKALESEQGNGRLWALYLQLKQRFRKSNAEDIHNILTRALRLAPKSGEVWCEGCRYYLNPMHGRFSLSKARDCITRALRYTPQFGDTFVEWLRLEILEKLKSMESKLWKTKLILSIDTSHVECRCVHADPNYGELWFQCKRRPYDTAKIVFERAKLRIAQNFENLVSQYREAIVREDRVPIVSSGSTDSLFASSWIKSDIYDNDDDDDDKSSDHLLFLTAFSKYSAQSSDDMRQTFVTMMSSPFDVDPIAP